MTTKPCEQCGTTMTRRRYENGTLEKPRRWAVRQFCSRECQATAQMGKGIKTHVPMWVEEDRGYETPCWVWQRSLDTKGYGKLGRMKRIIAAYKWTYEQYVGSVPDGFELDHLCRVRACVRPDHLEVVTHLTNMRRGAAARAAGL